MRWISCGGSARSTALHSRNRPRVPTKSLRNAGRALARRPCCSRASAHGRMATDRLTARPGMATPTIS